MNVPAMRFIFLSLQHLLLACVLCISAVAQTTVYKGPVPKPSGGYGQEGSYTVEKITFPSPTYKGKSVEIFYPKEHTGPLPVVFYAHPFGGEQSAYNMALYNFIAQQGYAVVFAPYATFGVTIEERYNTLWQSFKMAASQYPEIIDTRKAAFMGHSFGGGAVFSLAYKGFVEEGWGADGRFIFSQAPWYCLQITQQQLQSFPSNTKLIVQVYDDDVINDHRIAIDVFKTINIADAEKDFILVRKNKVAGYTYTAGHDLPSARSGADAYDYYAVYRLLNALIDYSFKGNASAKLTALGNGDPEQVTLPAYMGKAIEPLTVTDKPVAAYPQSKYQFPCENKRNPRAIYCGSD